MITLPTKTGRMILIASGFHHRHEILNTLRQPRRETWRMKMIYSQRRWKLLLRKVLGKKRLAVNSTVSMLLDDIMWPVMMRARSAKRSKSLVPRVL
jgi:hypothetical protein